MSFTTLLNRTCKQVAVYWGSPQDDGYGGKVFANAKELAVRWEDKEQLIRQDDGIEISSRAIVYVLQDVDLEGMMYLGTLDDLYDIALESSAGALDNPKEFDKTYVIKKFEKSPALGSTTDFVRKVWLTPLLT
jgi:hypothetical protein